MLGYEPAPRLFLSPVADAARAASGQMVATVSTGVLGRLWR